jgi:hypothetical protein
MQHTILSDKASEAIHQLDQDALVYAEDMTGDMAETARDAFNAGAERLWQYLNQFSDRIATLISERESDFERGQRDGVLWASQAIGTLVGKE